MTENNKLEIEVLDGAKDLEILESTDLNKIDDLSLFIFKPVSVRFLKKFKNLKKLMISGSVKDLSPVGDCTSLDTLYLSGPVDRLDFIQSLSIKTLKLEGIKSKVDILVIPNIGSLENIVISSVSKIVDLSFLADFVDLKTISLFELKSKKLFDFSRLKKLKQISLTNMFHLQSLEELKSIQNLETLDIHHFFVNRKMKIDIKSELLKVVDDLKNIKKIRLKINEEEYLNQR